MKMDELSSLKNEYSKMMDTSTNNLDWSALFDTSEFVKDLEDTNDFFASTYHSSNDGSNTDCYFTEKAPEMRDFQTPTKKKWKDINPDEQMRFTVDSSKTEAWNLLKREESHII